MKSATRLLQLFTSFSNPLFLLSDEGHPRLLFFMCVRAVDTAQNKFISFFRLEVFNCIIFYNLSDNPNVVYSILSSHKAFEDLGTFTLARGLREIKRAQVAKEELAQKQGNPKNKLSTEGEDSRDPGAEKARLLENEQDHVGAGSDAQDSPRLSDGTEERRSSEGALVTRSLMSPTAEAMDPLSFSPNINDAVSEKARGKMRERRSLSLEMNASLERIATSGIGRNGFVPTQEWVCP